MFRDYAEKLTGLLLHADVPIKYESHYEIASRSSRSPSIKRRRSDQSQMMGEKRQRVDSSPEHAQHDDITAILAQATERAKSQFMAPSKQSSLAPQPVQNMRQNEEKGRAGHSNGFMSDPYLYMRILSLPMLESLVGNTCANGIGGLAADIYIVYPGSVDTLSRALPPNDQNCYITRLRTRSSIFYPQVPF